jgi:hypothetical protein
MKNRKRRLKRRYGHSGEFGARRRRKFTKGQRRALALLILAERKYLANPTDEMSRKMRAAAQAAHKADAIAIYEFGNA